MSVLEDFLKKVEARTKLNAFTFVPKDSLTSQLEATARGPLEGRFIAVKDNIAVKGMPLTCASAVLENYVSPYNATAIERIQSNGGIIAGKTNLDEFAMGSSSEFSIYGPVHNPVDTSYVAGGSSGGSAAAVAGGIVDLALGTDTGGSVRQPASYCGIVGLKPSYGRISRYGLVAFASSLDQIGICSRTVSDAAQLLATIAGIDEQDATTVDEPVAEYAEKLESEPGQWTIGIPKEYFGEGIQKDVRQNVERVIAELKTQGVVFKEVSIPHTPHAIAIYYIISSAEASSNLARYDGVRYGLRIPDNDLKQMYLKTREVGFGPEVKRRIMLGTYVLSAGYYDAYYAKAQKVRRLLVEDFSSVFQEVDAVLTPTAPTTAFHHGEKLTDPLEMYLNDIYTVSANLAGIPAISIPAGVDGKGLPIGCQIMGPAFGEETILKLGTLIEHINW